MLLCAARSRCLPLRPCAAPAARTSHPSSARSRRSTTPRPGMAFDPALQVPAQPELATLFAGLLRAALHDEPAPDIALPAPLAEAAAERGFNQSWEIARRSACAPRRACCCASATRRTSRAAARQPRRQRVRGAFAVEPLRRGEIEGRRIALVDDVRTTGATAAEMARTLLAAGRPGAPVVLARTPAPGSSLSKIEAPCSTSCSCTPRSRPTPAT